MSPATKTRPRPNRYDIWVKRIYIAARKQGLDSGQVHAIVREMTGGEVDSTKRLWPHERRRLLRSLEGHGPYAASKEQIWAIENLWLLPLRLRKGWTWEAFGEWLCGPQTPITTPDRAREIFDNWPSEADRKVSRIHVSMNEAHQIIEGIKGLWKNLLNIEDTRAEYRRLGRILKLAKHRPDLIDSMFHQMKFHA